MSVHRLARSGSPSRRRIASRRPSRVHGPEPLESRAMLATFTVVAPDAPVNATTFRSLQEALAAASNGDTVRISPLAIVDDIAVSTTLAANAAIGATSIKTPVAVPFGQAVTLDNGVDPVETFVVIGSAPAAGGTFQLTLDSALTNNYVSGDPIVTTGDIAITKSITLTSVNGMLPGSIIDAGGLQVLADDVVLTNLLITSGINIMPGSQGTTFRNCRLSNVSDTPAGGSGARTFEDNVFFGNLILRDDADATTVDQINFNQFVECSLRLLANDGVIVRGNTFNTSGAATAISIESGEGVVVRQNTVTFSSPAGTGDPTPSDASIGIAVTGGGPGNPLAVDIVSNSLDTGGLGIGILLDVADVVGGGTNFAVKLQGNDLHWNTIGLLVDGDRTATATALGTIDAGAGSLGSLGGNNFRGFTAADASAGIRFAIYLANDSAATTNTVTASNNLWTTATPTQLVKDSANNTAAGGWAPGPGVGTVNLGASQLTGNQQFVQALYNRFLGRSGTLDEVNYWATKITLGSSTTQQVATAVITSQQAYGYYVDGLYHSILQRSPDASGRSSWISQLKAGASKESVAAAFTGSGEYFSKLSLLSLEALPLPLNQTGATGDAAYVTSLYDHSLERLPTNSELSSWLAGGPMSTSTRVSVAQAFLTSSECRNLIIRGDLYYKMLHRQIPPASSDVTAWNNSGQLLTQLQIAFASSAEFFANG